MPYHFGAALFLGWALGANDSANCFGTAVATGMIRWGRAALLTGLFVLLGAWIAGEAGLKTYGKGVTTLVTSEAVVVTVSAAVAATLLTILKLPISTSQCVAGALIALGLRRNDIQMACVVKMLLCWVFTPVGAAVLAYVLSAVLTRIVRRIPMPFVLYDRLVQIGLVCAGCYAAYALGANNVANVTGPYFGAGEMSLLYAKLFGGLAIAFGAMTFSRRVMFTVGQGVAELDPLGALIAVLACAITVHVYSLDFLGVPVSSSQAIIGGVLGVGLHTGMRTVNLRGIYRIVTGWVVTPVLSGLLAVSGCLVLAWAK